MMFKVLKDAHWKNWLHRPICYEYDENDEEYQVTIIDWVKTFVKEGLFPHFEKVGYLTSGSQQDFITALLNYIYRFEANSQNNIYITPYFDKYGRKLEYTMDDFDFFISEKCPPSFWNRMKNKFSIDFYADDSDFASRLWTDLPYMVFFCIDLKKSNATSELQERLCMEDEEFEGTTDTRKKDIDPYLLDYGGQKYKNYDNV